MNDRDADERELRAKRARSGGFGQRLLALVVFAFLAYLIWLAVTGQYDAQVDRFAGWLHRQYDQLRLMF